jgi:hypothetical protein
MSLSIRESIETPILKKNFGIEIRSERKMGIISMFFNKRTIVLFEDNSDYLSVEKSIETAIGQTIPLVDMWDME